VDAGEEDPCVTLAIDDRGLHLVQNRAGTWSIKGSADGLVHSPTDRLGWLLPLLERTPDDLRRAIPEATLTDSPIAAVVRFGRTTGGQYWPDLALRWLEAGWPTDGLTDVLAEMKDSRGLPQPLRRRALRLWLAAVHH